MAYRCKSCGKTHDDLPHIGADEPSHYWSVPERERRKRVELTTDTCVIDDNFFIRGVIEIPVAGEEEPFGFGVWVSQKRENFETYLHNFDSAEIGPFFGWLSTEIPYYPSTINLKTRAHFRGEGLRPVIELEPTEHPLSIDQRNGVSLDRAWEIVHFFMDVGPKKATKKIGKKATKKKAPAKAAVKKSAKHAAKKSAKKAPKKVAKNITKKATKKIAKKPKRKK